MTDRTDYLASKAHRRTLDLIGKIAKREKVAHGPNTADEQSAVLAGVGAALAEVMWVGRNDGATVETICTAWNALGKDLIEQASLHHMPASAGTTS